MSFQRTSCVKLRQQVCNSANGKILIRSKQSVKQMLQRSRLILNDHLPKFATENSV